jgi:hypothetical protein
VERGRVEELLTRAVNEQVQGLRDWRDALAGLSDRITALEDAVAELRVALPDAAGAQLRDVMSSELATTALIIRHEIDDLGRVLRADLDALRAPEVIDLTKT